MTGQGDTSAPIRERSVSVVALLLSLSIFLAGALLTTVTGLLMLLIGYKVLGIPYNLLLGMLAGMQTQPAVLGFATEQTENEIPNLGYALVFPIATVTKILYAQLLLTLLR